MPSRLLLLLVLLVAPGAAGAQVLAPASAETTGAIEGFLLDAGRGTGVGGATVRLRELGRMELSHPDGSFHFERLRPGRYTIIAERIGYAVFEREVTVSSGASVALELILTPTALTLQGIVVTGMGRPRGVEEAWRPTSVLFGRELDRRLGSSLAETLRSEPGVSVRSFGPAAAQPVIRGLSGDRVLVLENGQRTGDLSTLSGDHAVGIDPLSASRIEVVRGPAGLLYGGNALGGVVNAIREEIPRTVPDRPTGAAVLQLESATTGWATAGNVTLAATPEIALRVEAGLRASDDLRTPLGSLP